MRWIGIIGAAMIVLSGTVQAQIAAPRLNPLTIESMIVSSSRLNRQFNPAVLAWSGPSRIGGAVTDLEAEDTVAGVTTLNTVGDGQMLQGRYVGEFLSVMAEVYQSELDDPAGGNPFDIDGTLAALAVQFGEMVAVGAGQQKAEFSDPTSSQTETLPQAGVSVRLAEVIYLGAALGTETLEQSAGGTTVDADRDVNRIGVGYHSRMDDMGLHVEVFHETVDEINEPAVGITENEEISDGVTVEAVFLNILLGLETVNTDRNNVNGTAVETSDYTTVSLGWAPAEGLTIVASLIEEEIADNITGNTTVIETSMIGLGWLF